MFVCRRCPRDEREPRWPSNSVVARSLPHSLALLKLICQRRPPVIILSNLVMVYWIASTGGAFVAANPTGCFINFTMLIARVSCTSSYSIILLLVTIRERNRNRNKQSEIFVAKQASEINCFSSRTKMKSISGSRNRRAARAILWWLAENLSYLNSSHA